MDDAGASDRFYGFHDGIQRAAIKKTSGLFDREPGILYYVWAFGAE